MTENEYRADVERAVYAKIAADAEPGDGVPFLLGWAVVFEFTTDSMEQDDQTAVGQMVASNTQSRATSRGLFELGVDRFRT